MKFLESHLFLVNVGQTFTKALSPVGESGETGAKCSPLIMELCISGEHCCPNWNWKYVDKTNIITDVLIESDNNTFTIYGNVVC